MKITIENTEQILSIISPINGSPVAVRKWTGKTEAGVDCIVFVASVAVGPDVHESAMTEFDDLKYLGNGPLSGFVPAQKPLL